MSSGPPPSSELASRRMRNTPTRDTPCELALRRALFARGLRYRVDYAPLPRLRRKADIVFTSRRVAVFVDGCYWHACPTHGSVPKANVEWWREKFAGNVRRDRETDRLLRAAGWRVVRIWEHQTVDDAVAQVERALLMMDSGQR